MLEKSVHQTDSDRMHVLVVEDDADTRENLCDILALDGHSAETATSIADTLGRDNWPAFGAVILDRKLPDGTAEELLPRLRRLAPDAAVIVVTGYGDLEGAIAAIRHGAADYILKPISPDILLSRVARIAEHRRLLLEKVELERQVQQAEKLAAIGQFTAGLAHEIGTPLNVIMGRAEYMLRRIPREDFLKGSLESIVHQIERITKIVQQLLSFARPKPLELRPVRLHSLIHDVLGFFEHQLTQQGSRLSVDCPEGLPRVLVDQDQIQQVLFNIILNAIHAMPQGGNLKIHATRTIPRQDREDPVRDGYLKIEISDSGPGISEEQLKKIFDPFFSTKGVGQGTGLGLAVSYGIMKAHGGWIRVKSQVGQGTTFGLYLPLKSDLQTRPEGTKQADGPQPI
jgi:signal transduction histidine kinase